MKILLIDTCGETGSVALADTAIVATASLPGRTASERLLPTIRDLAARAFPLRSLDAVAVVNGPGSFTGVRVGLSAAKGLCVALDLPLITISRVAVLAHKAGLLPATKIHAVLDAGRGEFYMGVYCHGVCLGEALLTRDELLAAAIAERECVTVVCEPVVAESLSTLAAQPAALLFVAQSSAENALPLASLRIQEGTFDDVATIDANYLRRTDAEIFAKPRPSATTTSQPSGTALR